MAWSECGRKGRRYRDEGRKGRSEADQSFVVNIKGVKLYCPEIGEGKKGCCVVVECKQRKETEVQIGNGAGKEDCEEVGQDG